MADSLNALTGIRSFSTNYTGSGTAPLTLSLNALTGIRSFSTHQCTAQVVLGSSLNALTGIRSFSTITAGWCSPASVARSQCPDGHSFFFHLITRFLIDLYNKVSMP